MASVREPSGLLCAWANSGRRCPMPHSLLQGHGPRCSERPEWERGDVPCTGTWGTDHHHRFCTTNKGSSQWAHTPLADSRTIVSLLFRLRGCQPGWESGGHGGLGDAAPSPRTCRSGRGHRNSKAVRKQSLTLSESRQRGERQTVTCAGASSTVPFSTKAGAVGLSVLERPQGSHQGTTDEARAPASPSEQDTISRPLSRPEWIVPPSQRKQEARQRLVHAMSCPPYLGHIDLRRSNSRDTRANRVSPGGAFAKFWDVLVEANTIWP